MTQSKTKMSSITAALPSRSDSPVEPLVGQGADRRQHGFDVAARLARGPPWVAGQDRLGDRDVLVEQPFGVAGARQVEEDAGVGLEVAQDGGQGSVAGEPVDQLVEADVGLRVGGKPGAAQVLLALQLLAHRCLAFAGAYAFGGERRCVAAEAGPQPEKVVKLLAVH